MVSSGIDTVAASDAQLIQQAWQSRREQHAKAYAKRHFLNTFSLLLGSALAWCVSLVIIWTVFPEWHRQHLLHPGWAILIGSYFLLLRFARLLPGWGIGIVNELRGTVLSCMACAFGLLVVDALVHFHWQTLPVAFTLFIVTVITQLLARSAIKTMLLKRQTWGVPTVIYGAANTGQRVVESLRQESGMGFCPVAFIDDNEHLQGRTIQDLPVYSREAEWELDAWVAILAMPGSGNARYSHLIDGPLSIYRSTIIVSNFFDVQTLWTRAQSLGGAVGLQVTQQLADPLARILKRGIELTLVVLSMPFWVPLCLLIAFLIWQEDRQSPLFFQERVGLGGRPFQTWKFRTMVPNAEAVLQQRLQEDPALMTEWQTHFKLKRDPRITRIGHFLRKTSLDEFPQLVNVLRGEMALIGPRPLPQYHQQELPMQVQLLRVQVRPGMTGLWQVSGRSDAGNEGMIQLDPYYVRNWSIWLDFMILLRTFRAVVRSAGAY